MARRNSILSTIATVQREVERRQAAQLRAQRHAYAASVRAQKAYEQAQAASEKEKRRLYVESRLAHVEALNETLAYDLEQLSSLLAAALRPAQRFTIDKLRRRAPNMRFDPGALGIGEPGPNPYDYEVLPLTRRQAIVPGARQRQKEAIATASSAWESAVAEWQRREADRLAELRRAHDSEQQRLHAEVEQHNRHIAEIYMAWRSGDPAGVTDYAALVLDSSSYPEGFPHEYRFAYLPESNQLVVEFELPPVTIVPSATAYRYVRQGDKVTEAARSAKDINSRYLSVICQVALRTVRELLVADDAKHFNVVVFNGMLSQVDPSTGRDMRPCVVSVRVSADTFNSVDLARVDPVACLMGLNAAVSRSPVELAPVRPVLDISMVDPRFVTEQDILSSLDQRPNLMELTPSEFESLITNLFSKMGLETKLTQASRDGGVDCVAYDPRPVLGGKVVVQAKRYKHTVGVSAVRDLFGTVHNEGASKGILVATSGFGKAAFEFASGKPLELLSGSNLLYLLEQHTGLAAKIEPPEDWVDPPESS